MNWKMKKFNELELHELYNILALRTEVFVVEQECPYQDCDGKDEQSYHLFCEEEGHIIAYLRVIEKGVSYAEISIGRVCVDKNYRGSGIAKDMMLKAIRFVRKELKENKIKIQAQAYLISFYKSLGFKEISKEYLEDGIPHINMLYEI